MDTFTASALEELIKKKGFPRVSIFLPTVRAGREVQQNSIRFKNLLDKAMVELVGTGMESRTADRLLEPAARLLKDTHFWRHQSDGLATFIEKDDFNVFRLPVRFEELIVVTDYFHVKPLVSFVAADRLFYVLALSQKEVRLIKCTRQSAVRVPLKNVPENIFEATHIDQSEKELQFHTGTPGRTGKRDAIFHGTGAAGNLDTKKAILKYFRQIDRGISPVLQKKNVPLVFSSVDYMIPIYKEANTYPHFAEQGILGNPEDLTAEELRDRALEILEPYFKKGQAYGYGRYEGLAGTGLASNDLKEVILAAHHARVDTLFVPVGVNRWGRFDPKSTDVELHASREPGDQDLLDLIAVQSLSHGAQVFAVSPSEVPGDGELAAIFRF